MKELSKAEEIFLVAIWGLKENAYGVVIRDRIHELTGKMYTYGTLYKILDQIVHRGYVTKTEGAPTNESGGRRKLFYKLTPMGIEALKTSFSVQKSLWMSLDWNLVDGV